ncbi:MAG: hypothetical protein ABIG03_01495 [Candidatus Eisenbacteria bacterium]
MRRGLMVGLVVAVMLVACTAQAGFYGGLRFAGPLNLKEFAFGTQSEAFGAEVAIGYTSVTITDLGSIDEALDVIEPTGSMMSIGAAAFFQIAGNEMYGFDVGGRAQYLTLSGEVTIPDDIVREDMTLKASLTGLSFGPVLRGRWYLVEDSICIGPEIYFVYSSYSTEIEGGGETIDGPGATVMGLEYSLRMDFYF